MNKICASSGVLSEADPVDVPQLTSAALGAILAEARDWGRKVAAHSHSDLATRPRPGSIRSNTAAS